MNYSKIRQKITHCLCPPGDGVYTVNTATSRKLKIQNFLYNTNEKIEKYWQNSLQELGSQKVYLLGICSDVGAGILKGSNWGPLFIREMLHRKFPQLKYLDLGDIKIVPHFHHDKYLNQETIKKLRQALYGSDQLPYAVSALSITEEILTDIYNICPQQRFLALGGDHSVSYPLIKTYLKSRKALNKKTAIIHFDAHTDLLSSRMGVDICFGSWCTHILPDLENPSLLIQLGIRSSKKNKHYWQSLYGIQQYWSQDILTRGARTIAHEILYFLHQQKIQEIYISFDIDAIDGFHAPATGTPEPQGIIPEQAILIIDILCQSVPVGGADMVEVSPFLHNEFDLDGTGQKRTVLLATEICSKFIQAMNP